MKKILLFMCWVVIINLIFGAVPVMAVEGDVDVGESEVVDVGEEELDEEDEAVELPILYFRAVNPGYKVEGVNNVGEMIEISKNSDDSMLLAGVTVSYTNSSGKEAVLVEFPENSLMTGESILLRLASTPESELANLTYASTLAMKAGPLRLLVDGEVVDEVCWTGKDDCAKDFKSATPTTLVRNLETGEFEHLEEYEVSFDAENYKIVEPEVDEEDGGESDTETENLIEKPVEDEKNENSLEEEEEKLIEKPDEDEKDETDAETEIKQEDDCKNLAFSEVLTYWAESQAEQFVEFYNVGETAVLLNACQIKYKNIFYPLVGTVDAKSYAVRYVDDFKLTKNPKSSNVLELVDSAGRTVDVLEYQNGQKKGTSLALVVMEDGEKIWKVTYKITPGEENEYQEYRSCAEGQYLNPVTGLCKKIEYDDEEEKVCEEGYYLNESTGRCRKIVVEEEKTCKEGYYLNEETGRCRKIVEETIKTCPAGQYLNPETGRCKKIEVEEAVAKTCPEGYYLNESTGRCRKIVENNGADYSLEAETYEESSSFVALYAVVGVVAVIVVYVIYEFRREIVKLFRRIVKK